MTLRLFAHSCTRLFCIFLSFVIIIIIFINKTTKQK